MKEWLIDLLQHWFIPKEDYQQVQYDLDRAIKDKEYLTSELTYWMDQSYSKYESIAETLATELVCIQTTSIRFRAFAFTFTIPERVFYTSHPLESIRLKDLIAKRLGEKVTLHARKQLG